MPKKKKTAMSEFFTRSAHNEPKKMPLFTPEGKETGEFLMVLGAESDEARKAKNAALRDAANHAAAKKLDDGTHEELTVRMLAAHVADWSFDEDLSIDAAIKLLTEAPYIRDQLDRFSSRASNFSKKQKA